MINEKNIPLGLIASEYSLNYNGISKRADVVVFNRERKPVLIVECKATDVQLSEKTLQQIAQYNFKLDVDMLMLTNGLQHVVCQIDRENHQLNYLNDLPDLNLL